MEEERYQVTDKGRVLLAATSVLEEEGLDQSEAWEIGRLIADEAADLGISSGLNVSGIVEAIEDRIFNIETERIAYDPEEQTYQAYQVLIDELVGINSWIREVSKA